MRSLFSWRIKPSEAQFSDLWENATFVFDTNFLLDLYRVSRFTAEDVLKTLEHLQDRIWLPYQVVNEFFDRREGVIHSEAESFQKALSELEKWKTEQQTEHQKSFSRLRGCFIQVGRIVSDGVKDLFNDQKTYLDAIEKVEQSFREKIEQLEKDHTSLNPYEDIILEKLLLLFDTKVGEPFAEEDLANLHKEADNRYQRLQAPGFKDKDKNDERKYGDFILWKQILNFAKKESRPIIFVTSEKKDDWWIIRRGEIVSPREDLRREFLECTQKTFWMYRTQRFLELAEKKLKVEINPRSIDEIIAIADLESVDETDDESLIEQIQLSDSATQSLEQNKMSKVVSQILADSNLAKAFAEQSNFAGAARMFAEQSNFARAMAEQYNLTGVARMVAESNKILAEQYNFAGAARMVAESNNLAKAMAEQYNLTGVARMVAESNKILAEQYNLTGAARMVAEQSNFAKAMAEQSNLTGVAQIVAESNNLAKALAERSNRINALTQMSDELSQVDEQAKIADDS